MAHLEMIRAMCLGVICLGIIVAATSCSDGNSAEVKIDNNKVGGESLTDTVVAVEVSKELTQEKRLESECRRLLAGTRREGERPGWLPICDLCNEIRKLPKEEALPLFDRWIEMAIGQPLAYTNYSTYAKLPERFFHVVLFASMASHDIRTDPFEHWDKIFRFFAKYTGEITAVEKDLKERVSPQNRHYYQNRRYYSYLHDLQLCTGGWVYMIETVFPDAFSKGLTEEQKADILRRLDEVKKYTVPPSHSPFNKMIPTQGGNDK